MRFCFYGTDQRGELRLCGEKHRDYEDALMKLAEENLVYDEHDDGLLVHFDEWESFLNWVMGLADDYNDGLPTDLDGLVDPGDFLMVPYVVYGG